MGNEIKMKARISITIDPDVLADVKLKAKKDKRSASFLIEQACAELIEREAKVNE